MDAILKIPLSWIDISVTNSTCCSCRQSQYSSQHLNRVTETTYNSKSRGHNAYDVWRHLYISIHRYTYILIIKTVFKITQVVQSISLLYILSSSPYLLHKIIIIVKFYVYLLFSSTNGKWGKNWFLLCLFLIVSLNHHSLKRWSWHGSLDLH